ncbi:MAG: serine hydrolase [Bacteroidales bacterium]|jgi:beta-glucosidase-like glycosyl hydrolase/CubicO group peptidase (beta-lactamase class C family)|nr:serine hydrolase [Bacteroidales bacterium]
MKCKIIFFLFLSIFSFSLISQNCIKERKGKAQFVSHLIQKMSLEEKIGQIIMVAADSETGKANINNVGKMIDSCKIGGVCFFKGTQTAVASLTKTFNTKSKIPLFFAIDAEWGTGMRLSDGYSFPRALALGALDFKDTLLLYEMGINIAQQLKNLGIQINFAPSLDINLNWQNPIINSRSFGENKEKVTILSHYYIKGMQSQGVMAVAKHFPGHGDTETDSHLDLPLITHSKSFIDSVDVFPFKYNISKGLWGIMVAHLSIPAFENVENDTTKILPTSLNSKIINDYLINDLKFKGLVFTDGLNMKGITKYYGSGEAAVMAVIAGVDVLLMPENCYEAANAIRKAVEENRINEELIDKKCKKIIEWKYDMGLFSDETLVMSDNVIEKANEIDSLLSYSVLTLLNNKDNILPIKADTLNFLIYSDSKLDTLVAVISKHCAVKIVENINALDTNTPIFIAVGGSISQTAATNYGVSSFVVASIDSIAKTHKNIILLLFANPYVLKSFDSINFNAIVVAYQTNALLQKAVGNALMEKKYYTASLPVTASEKYKVGDSYKEKPIEYDYFSVEKAGLDVDKFRKIDSIANLGIKKKAYPGCQIAVFKDSSLVFYRNYGYQTYDSIQKVSDSTTYDLASVTKILATTISIMKLYEEKKININDKLSDYLPYLKKTNKAKITIKETLSHYAQLKAWYPFYKEQMQAEDSLKYKFNKDYVLKKIIESDLGEKNKYVYSDLGFILLGDLVEKVSEQSLDEFAKENFYEPMGLDYTAFNPQNKISDSLFAPTERDTLWRKTLVSGKVHDQTATLMNGIAGHAGLFSTAKEVTALCEVLLCGKYKGVQYIEPQTLEIFNKRYFEKKGNRRALGFDKPFIKDKSTHCSPFASQKSFGHSGFTGTYFWIDPEYNLIYVFISNRVYPDATNNKLATMNIRTDISSLIYEAITKQTK